MVRPTELEVAPYGVEVAGEDVRDGADTGGEHRRPGLDRRRGRRRRRDAPVVLREERRAAHLAAHPRPGAVHRGPLAGGRGTGRGRGRRGSRWRFLRRVALAAFTVALAAFTVAVGQRTGRRRALGLLRRLVGGAVRSSRLRVPPPSRRRVEGAPGRYGGRHHLLLFPRSRREHGATGALRPLAPVPERGEPLGRESPGVLGDSLRRREGIPAAPKGTAFLPVEIALSLLRARRVLRALEHGASGADALEVRPVVLGGVVRPASRLLG
mmetsp:Transcript_5014/g.18819  ORF Transcript_5014/g.18819 Transcript_5014/m.18819 type:complete len:268 (+) Transcript_5014:1640-2443(+)